MKPEFPRQIFKKPQISNFVKIRQAGTELFQADRQTDRRITTKLIVALRNTAQAPA